MERSSRNRMTGTAVRPISGSPRSPRRRSGRGTSSLRAKGRRRSAARSRARSPCSAKCRRAPSREMASGQCARHGTGAPRICIRRGPRRSSTRPSTKSRRGRRCTRCCATDRTTCSSTLYLREDEKGLILQPDCADVPYFLRAYFAFKMGLPFGYSKCTRGDGGQAPRCPQWWNNENEEPTSAPPGGLAPPGEQVGFFGVFAAPGPVPVLKLPPKPQGLVPGFGYYLRTTIANGVQSGNGRTAADDNDTDYYPVALSEDTLRPGTIYADP